jgi:adenine-specific DNA methylase
MLQLGVGRCADWNSRLCRWDSSAANEKSTQTFSNQALNTLFNFGVRPQLALRSTWLPTISRDVVTGRSKILALDARQISQNCDLWITDPPYADAVKYEEISEYFLAWYQRRILSLFSEWYTDSKRALAIKGSDNNFKQSMVECYHTLAEHMPDNGLQVVMFTHQDAGVWADLTLILRAAGLRVTAAWCISTETPSAMKDGNYVQGTVLLVLRKQKTQETAFLDEIYPQVEVEVRRQLDSMLEMDDLSDPNFADTDYQLAAYAAALRVLTSKKIEEIDVSYELTRVRASNEVSQVEEVIRNAVVIACDHLVPRGMDKFLWKSLSAFERFYLKGLEMESHAECRIGVYQELARGFGIQEYKSLLADTKANQSRLKSASEFGRKELSGEGFSGTLLRQVLFGIFKTVETESPREAITWFMNEIENYAGNRSKVIQILEYLGSLQQHTGMVHWHKDANAAAILAGALRNRQDNV